MTNTVCFFSFGYSHLFYHNLIKLKSFNEKFKNPKIIFIVPNRTHKSFYERRNYRVYYLSDINYKEDISFIKSDNKSIATQKKSIINLKSIYQENLYFKMDLFINNIFIENKVSHIIFSQAIEGLAGVLICENAKKLGINCYVPHSTRFLNTTFFSKNQYEKLELNNIELSSKSIEKAKILINQIRLNEKTQTYIIEKNKKNFFLYRVLKYLIRITIFEKIDFPRLFVSIENNLSLIYQIKYNFRGVFFKKYITIKEMNELPEKFIFFPLQYTPESSINIPNPY